MDRQANRTPALFPLIAFECQVGNTHSADYQAHFMGAGDALDKGMATKNER